MLFLKWSARDRREIAADAAFQANFAKIWADLEKPAHRHARSAAVASKSCTIIGTAKLKSGEFGCRHLTR